MWLTALGIALAAIGLVTATSLWNKIQGNGKLIILGILLIGIIVLNVHSYFEAKNNDETIEELRENLRIAKQELVESDKLRKKLIEYDEIARLNADGSTGLIKKGGGLSGGDTDITPKAQNIWIYSGENDDARRPKCDKDGIKQAKRMTEEHPKFPFPYYMLAVCQKATGNQEWIKSAQGALDILEFTTQVPGHNGHHDVARNHLSGWLKELEIN